MSIYTKKVSELIVEALLIVLHTSNNEHRED